MDKANLKRIRLIAPGIVFLICVSPFLGLSKIREIADKIPDSIFYVLLIFICLGIGVIYYVFDVRDLIWRRVVHACHENIRNKLIKPFRTDPVIGKAADRIPDQDMMVIFYNLLDNDESLKDRQNDVRMNGVILTTVIDFFLLLIPFSLAYVGPQDPELYPKTQVGV